MKTPSFNLIWMFLCHKIIILRNIFCFHQYTGNSDDRIRINSLQDMVLENFHKMEADDFLNLIRETLRFVRILFNQMNIWFYMLFYNNSRWLFNLDCLATNSCSWSYAWCFLLHSILVDKLWGFHYRGIIHGNLKPQNVLMHNGECTFTSLVNDGEYTCHYYFWLLLLVE